MLPIFQGEQRAPHETLYFHFTTDRALRQGDWKIASAKKGRWELYNVAEDRTELNDLSQKYPERVSAMAAEWFRIAEQKERLTGKQLAPVSYRIVPLRFRGDSKAK